MLQPSRLVGCPRVALVALGIALLFAGRSAGAATFYDLAVVPSLSWLELLPGSALVVNVGGSIGSVSAALESPAGSGATDGLRAALQGNLRVRHESTLVFPEVHLAPAQSVIELAAAGAFSPGLPGAQGTPAPAGWAIRFGANTLGIAGNVALRDFFLVPSGGGRLATIGPDDFVFPSVFPSPPLPAPFLGFEIARGAFDIAASFTSDERFVPGETTFQAPIDPANRPGFSLPGAGLARMTIPLRASVVVTAADLGSPLPFELRLEVGGQIVAQNFPIPEPGSVSLLAAGLAWLARRRARTEDRDHA